MSKPQAQYNSKLSGRNYHLKINLVRIYVSIKFLYDLSDLIFSTYLNLYQIENIQ